MRLLVAPLLFLFPISEAVLSLNSQKSVQTRPHGHQRLESPNNFDTWQCPQGSVFNSIRTNCLFFVQTPLNYQAAEATCNNIGGHLTSVHSGFENTIISSGNLCFSREKRFAGNATYIFYGTDGYWIGANKLANGLQWSWTDFSQFDYVNWAPGEPNPDPGARCVAHNTGDLAWKAVQCNQTRPFVCEVPTVSVSQQPACSENPCPVGYYLYADEVANQTHCYKFMGTSGTWSELENLCIREGGHLVSIHSEIEQRFVYLLGYPQRWFWTGLHSPNADNNYVWTDGSPYDYQKWMGDAGPPEQPEWSCVAMLGEYYDGRMHWENYKCAQVSYGGVCKRLP